MLCNGPCHPSSRRVVQVRQPSAGSILQDTHLPRSHVYTHTRFAQAVTDDDPFVAEVLSASKIWLVGDDSELERMAR